MTALAVLEAAPVPRVIDSADDAARLIDQIIAAMDALVEMVEDETALVRAGRLGEAAQLEQSKKELAQHYLVSTERLKANGRFIAEALPERLEQLRQHQNQFHAVLQINLAVLATAHAVSEGIIRGVAHEVHRKAAPQTYDTSGRQAAPPRAVARPVAVSRTL
jgi:hypothetical protein